MQKRCLNCFKEYDAVYEVCPHCGFVEGTPPKELYHLHPGEILHGKYIVGTVVGYGGFGIIYRVWDAHMEQAVAIKEYFPSGLVNRTPGQRDVIVYSGKSQEIFEAGLERYLLEARNMAAFSHPNIVSLFDFFEENNTAYIVMELLDGISLKTYLLQNEGKLSCEEMLEVMLPIMDALEEMHKHNIIHRDVSPDNIFLCTGNRMKLIDFGAARFSDSKKEETRSIVLKPGYAPPEQYRGKSRQGPFTDVYAVGACMYRAVTGAMPEESLNRMMEDTLKEPKELEPDLPDDVNTIILKAMALSPEYRFQTIRDMKDALEGKKTVTSYQVEIKMRRRLSRTAAVAAFVGIAVIAGGLYYGVVNHTRLLRVGNYKGDVNFYVPESQVDYYKTIEQDFEMDNNGEDITIVAVPDDSYKEEVLADAGKEDGAVLFFSDTFSEEEMEMAENLQNPVVEKLGDLEHNFYYLSDFYKTEANQKCLPLNFSVPLIVENTKVGVKMSGPVQSVGDLDLKPKRKKKGNVAIYKIKDNVVAQVDALSVDASQTVDSETGIQQMTDNTLGYYITDWADYKALVTNATNVETDILYPAENVQMTAKMCNYLSISEDAHIQARMIAEDFAQYIINSQAAYLSSFQEDVLPVNRDAVESFTNIWVLSLASSVSEEDGKTQFAQYLDQCTPEK